MSESVKWYTMDEIAKHLGISRDTLTVLIKEKNLPAYRVGGKWRLDIHEVDKWVKEQHYDSSAN